MFALEFSHRTGRDLINIAKRMSFSVYITLNNLNIQKSIFQNKMRLLYIVWMRIILCKIKYI